MNITFGGYRLTEDRIRLLSSSVPYLQSSLGFAYKETKVHIFSIHRLFKPFTLPVWVLILILLFSSTLIILATKKLKRRWRHFFIGGRLNRTPLLNMWLLVLGKAIVNARIISGSNIGTFSRTITLLWIILWFLIRSYYEAALYTFLRNGELTLAYDTINKVTASDCKVLTGTSTLTYVENVVEKNRYVWTLLLSNQLVAWFFSNWTFQYLFILRIEIIDVDILTKLEQFHDNDINGVVLSNYMSWEYFNLINSPRRRLGFTLDRLFMYCPAFFFPKKSVLKRVFNKELLRLQEMGLIEHWMKKYMDKRKMIPNQHPQQFQMSHFSAAFEISFVLYLISMFIFILELLSYRNLRIKIVIEWLNYW